MSLLAGCAAPQQAPRPVAAAPQGVFYRAQVLSVRIITVSGSAAPALGQVMQALGTPPAAAPATAEEVVVQLPDGSVKSLVPPPGAAPASLAPGAQVVITETPQLRISAR